MDGHMARFRLRFTPRASAPRRLAFPCRLGPMAWITERLKIAFSVSPALVLRDNVIDRRGDD